MTAASFQERAWVRSLSQILTSCTAVVLLLLMASPGELSARRNPGGDAGDSVSFQWTLAGARQLKSGFDIFYFNSDTVLHTKNKMRFYFKPQSTCYPYLFLVDPKGGVNLLYPTQTDKIGKVVNASSELAQAPAGKGWFTLNEDTGNETFYLLVSATPLTKVESAYLNLKAPQKDASVDYTRAFLTEVRNAIKSTIKGGAKIADIPSELGGTIRGFRETLDVNPGEVNLTNVTAKALYTKKIVVKHIN